LLLEERGELVREVDDFLLQLNDFKYRNVWLKAGKRQAEHQRDSLRSQNQILAEVIAAMGEKLAEVDVTAVKDHFSAYGGLGNIQE
jgi:hypothetical protein